MLLFSATAATSLPSHAANQRGRIINALLRCCSEPLIYGEILSGQFAYLRISRESGLAVKGLFYVFYIHIYVARASHVGGCVDVVLVRRFQATYITLQSTPVNNL